MSSYIQSISAWLSSHPEWLGIVLFAGAFFECLAIAGLLIPGTVLLFALGVLAGNGVLSLSETLILAFAGGLLGDIVSYGLGRRFHGSIRQFSLLRRHPQWLDHAERHIERYGIISLLIGRFIGPLRPMLPLLAGMLSMPFIRFVLVSIVASAGWSIAYMLPGWSAGAAMRLPLPPGFWTEAAIVVGTLGIALAVCIQQTMTGKHYATILTCGVCGVLFIALMLGLQHFKSLDQGIISVVQEAREPKWDNVIAFITGLGDFKAQLLAGIVACLVLLLAKDWRAFGFAVFTGLGTAVANGLIKHTLERTRPEVLVDPLHTFSFPSGHSSASFAFCLTLGVIAGRGQAARLRLTWLLVACLPAILIAASRIYLGVHWPTDIIAGALLAGFFCSLSLFLTERVAPMQALPARHWAILLPVSLAALVAFALWVFPHNLELYRYQ